MEKHFPDATMSRGIIFNLRRKMPNEQISRLRHADKDIFIHIASKLARFADDYSQQVKDARPSLPDELSDRAQDNWESLFAIAECAGTQWQQRAKDAALKLSNVGNDSVSTGNELLADIRIIFMAIGEGKISTEDLIRRLVADEESPWATYSHGKPITPRNVSKLLGEYGIHSKTVRLGANNTPKEYDKWQFADAFDRYLTPLASLPQRRNDPKEAMNGKGLRVADAPQQLGNATDTLLSTSEGGDEMNAKVKSGVMKDEPQQARTEGPNTVEGERQEFFSLDEPDKQSNRAADLSSDDERY